MPTYEVADTKVRKQMKDILEKFESHQPVLDAEVKIDLLFAFGDRDDDGELVSNALNHHGVPALGLTRKLSLKDRTAGRGDAEIILDGDWWKETASPEQQDALLDHECHHLEVKRKQQGGKWIVLYDALGRPQLKLRKHDVQIGWFNLIAVRHGSASQERIQAQSIFDNYGQYYWPEIAKEVDAKNQVEISAGGEKVAMPLRRFQSIGKEKKA